MAKEKPRQGFIDHESVAGLPYSKENASERGDAHSDMFKLHEPK